MQAVEDESAAPVEVGALKETAPESASTSQVDSTGLSASEDNTADTVSVPSKAAATGAGTDKETAGSAGKEAAVTDVANLKEAVTDTMTHVVELAKEKTAEQSGKVCRPPKRHSSS